MHAAGTMGTGPARGREALPPFGEVAHDPVGRGSPKADPPANTIASTRATVRVGIEQIELAGGRRAAAHLRRTRPIPPGTASR